MVQNLKLNTLTGLLKKNKILNLVKKILPLTINESYYGVLVEGAKKGNALNLIMVNLEKEAENNVLNSNFEIDDIIKGINLEDRVFEYKPHQLKDKTYFIVISKNDYFPEKSKLAKNKIRKQV